MRASDTIQDQLQSHWEINDMTHDVIAVDSILNLFFNRLQLVEFNYGIYGHVMYDLTSNLRILLTNINQVPAFLVFFV
jgi:hypothetical protein